MKNYKLIIVGFIFSFVFTFSSYAGCSTSIYGLSGNFITEVNKTITLDFRHDYIDFGSGKVPIKTCVVDKYDSLDVSMTVDLPPEQGGESMITISLRENYKGPRYYKRVMVWDNPPTYPIVYTISSLDKGQMTETGKMSLLNSDSRTNMSSIPIVTNTNLEVISPSKNNKVVSGAGGWEPSSQAVVENTSGGGGWDTSGQTNTSQNTKVLSNNNSNEYTFPNGNRYFGTLENGLPNGVGTITAPNGTKYEGTVSHGMINGHGIMYFTTGNRHEGEFLNGVQNGFGTFYYNNGGIVVGVFKNGYPIDTAVYTDKDGNYFHGNYKQYSPYNGDIYNAANQSIGKVINGKNSYYRASNQQENNQQNQSNENAGETLGKIFGALIKGATAYQEGKNAALLQQAQQPIIINNPPPPVENHETCWQCLQMQAKPPPPVPYRFPDIMAPPPAISAKTGG